LGEVRINEEENIDSTGLHGINGEKHSKGKIDIDEIPIPFTFIRFLSLADFLVLDFLSKLLRFLRVTYLHFCIMYYTRYPGGLWLATNYFSKSVLYSSSKESICWVSALATERRLL